MKLRESRSGEPTNENRRRTVGRVMGAIATTALAIGANFGMALHSFADSPVKAKPATHASAPARHAAAKPAHEASGNAAAIVIIPTIEAADPFNARNLEIAGGVGGFGAASIGLAFGAARRSRRADRASHSVLEQRSLTSELGLGIINVQEPADEPWRPADYAADIAAAALEAGATKDTAANLTLQDELNGIFDKHYAEAQARIPERARTEAAIAAMLIDLDAQCAAALALSQPTLEGTLA